MYGLFTYIYHQFRPNVGMNIPVPSSIWEKEKEKHGPTPTNFWASDSWVFGSDRSPRRPPKCLKDVYIYIYINIAEYDVYNMRKNSHHFTHTKKTTFYYTSCHISPLNHLDKSWWLQAPVDWFERHAPSQQKQLKPQKATLQKRGQVTISTRILSSSWEVCCFID